MDEAKLIPARILEDGFRAPAPGVMTVNFCHEKTLAGLYPCSRRRMSRVGVSAIKPERFSAV